MKKKKGKGSSLIWNRKDRELIKRFWFSGKSAAQIMPLVGRHEMESYQAITKQIEHWDNWLRE